MLKTYFTSKLNSSILKQDSELDKLAIIQIHMAIKSSMQKHGIVSKSQPAMEIQNNLT